MDVKNTHSVTKTEISVFGRQALDAERRRSPSLAYKVLRAADRLSAYLELKTKVHHANWLLANTLNVVVLLMCFDSPLIDVLNANDA